MYNGVPGLLQMWTTPRKGSGRFFSTDTDGIEQAIDHIEVSGNLEGQQGVYARITTLATMPDTSRGDRGTAAMSSHFIGLWTDLDFGTTGHKGGNLPRDAAAAQAVYDASGLLPASITVNSGGGLYHIVKLADPLDVTDPATRMRVAALSRRWQAQVKIAAEKQGFSYGTGVSDLSRVLRIPGTVNAKDWNKRRATGFMSTGLRYTLDELEETCPAPPRPTRSSYVSDHAPASDARARMNQLLDEMRATTFERNNALNRLAYMCYQYAGAGQLDPAEVEREFTAAALTSGLDESEVTATVRSASQGLQRPYTWTVRLRAEQSAEQVDMWAGEATEDGHVTDPDTTTPTSEPESASQETPAVEIAANRDDSDPLPEPADPLTDTRLPEIVGKFRASSDKKPYTVATQLRDTFFLHGGKPTLMRWQDIWVRWNGSCWGTMSDADVTSWLYQRMDAAYMTKKVDGNLVDEPWNPANSSITNLDKALRAAVNLRDDTKQNTMVGEGVHDLAISCTNGLLRVTGRELAPADPAYFTFSSVPFGYDGTATCPQWATWLEETFAHDPTSIDMIQEWFGYVLSGRTDLQKALMLQGPERSGKGTIARILQMMAGWLNCAGPTLNSLTEQFGMWALTDKTLAVIGDARLPKKGTEVITERLLSIIGEDTIQVDRKYQRPWQGKIPARLMLLTNDIPNWADSAGVLPTRWLVATTVTSYLNNEDTGLADRLATELPGILNWALDGLDRLAVQRHFTVNSATPEIVGAQRDRSAPQKGFIAEACVLGDDKWVSKERLREMWTLWNRSHGRQVADTRESFTTKLLGMVPTIKAKDQKKRIDGKLVPIYRGIGLLADHPDIRAERDQQERAKEESEKKPEPTGQQTFPDPEPPKTIVESVPPPRNGTGPTRHADEVRSSVNSILRTLTPTINPTRHRSEEDRQ
jgi:putative DNA primase/helicase